MKTLRLALFISIMILVGCNLGSAQSPTPILPATLPHVRLAQADPVTPVPTAERDVYPVATAQPGPTLTPTPLLGEAPPLEPLPTRHTVTAMVDYERKSAEVQHTIVYENTEINPIYDMVLDVEANNWFNGFALESLKIAVIELEYSLNNNDLRFALPQPLQPGESVTIELRYRVIAQRIEGGVFAFRGFFGYTDRQFNLGNWLAMVSARRDGEWVIHTPIFVGEQLVLDQADWDVTLIVTGASDALMLAAPGQVAQLGTGQWHVVLQRARDFAISLSEEFNILSAETEDGVIVEVYSFDDTFVQMDDGPVDAAAHVLRLSVRSIDMFSDLYGDFPFSRMVVVEGDFPDGMEFSGLVFVGKSYFLGYTGEPTGYLTLITVHEISHQWWYVRVGNDSALHPWLDEALATYSEYVYIEEFYPVLKDWWWTFRVDNYFPEGAVDSTVYEFASPRDYINAVYLRGVRMMHAIREDVGTEEFFDILYRYVQAGDGKIVGPEVFWSMFTPAQIELTRATRSFFLREPDVNIVGGGGG